MKKILLFALLLPLFGASQTTVTIGDAATDALLLDGNNSAFHLGRANHTGTQLLSTISDESTITLLGGREGGQTLIGATDASENLTLSSTSNATKGKILFGNSAYDEVNNRLGIGTAAPTQDLSVQGVGIFGTPNVSETLLGLSVNTSGHEGVSLFHDGTEAFITSVDQGAAWHDLTLQAQSIHFDLSGSTDNIIFDNTGTITAGTWGATTIAVNKGGTGTATAFTTGSIVFAGASGIYSQDNANLFWDNTNNRLGIGIAAPLSDFHIVRGSKTSAGEQVKWNIGTDDGGGTMELATRVFGGATGADRYVDIQSVEQGVSVRALALQPSGGNVGIGTTTPAQALDVNGMILATSYKTNQGMANNSTFNNADVRVETTGVKIKRNIADANPTLTVQQIHASSTGDILQLKNSGGTVVTVTQTGNVDINGFTKLGSDAPNIKFKKFTGTTPSSEGGQITAIVTGIAQAKIIGFQAVVWADTGFTTPVTNEYQANNEFQFSVWHDSAGLKLKLHPTNSASVVSDAFAITIMYEE